MNLVCLKNSQSSFSILCFVFKVWNRQETEYENLNARHLTENGQHQSVVILNALKV